MTTRAKAKKMVKLVFPHEQGRPGTVKTFFNLKCVARTIDGLYECEVDEERARQELRRKNTWRFVRPESLVDREEDF